MSCCKNASRLVPTAALRSEGRGLSFRFFFRNVGSEDQHLLSQTDGLYTMYWGVFSLETFVYRTERVFCRVPQQVPVVPTSLGAEGPDQVLSSAAHASCPGP